MEPDYLENKHGCKARIIADSMNSLGDRVTSFEVTTHRFTLAEWNTHCLSGDTVLEFDTPTPQPSGSRRKLRMTIGEFVEKWQYGSAPRLNKRHSGTNRQPMRARLAKMKIRQLDEQTGLITTAHVLDARYMGDRPVYEVRTSTGQRVKATDDHAFYTPKGYYRLFELAPGDEVAVSRFGKREEDLLDPYQHKKIGGMWRSAWQRDQRIRLINEFGGCQRCGSVEHLAIHHIVSAHVDPGLTFDKDNIELLCTDCHQIEHHDQSAYRRGGTYLYGDVAVIESITPVGTEPTYDIEVGGPYHNFVANGIVVHNCLFARNSASSRAIPFARQLQKFMSTPAYPVEWPSEKPGMSGGALLKGQDRKDAVDLWDEWHHATSDLLLAYSVMHPEPETRLHKSLLNRLMEPGQWHTMLITAANFENFFELRVSPHAQPEIRAAAALMQELFKAGTPRQLNKDDWHLPYLRDNETAEGGYLFSTDSTLSWPEGGYDAREISSSRCAATSYETQWAEKGYTKEIERYTGLTDNGHWSPLEHVCTPWPTNVTKVAVPDPDDDWRLTGHVRRVARLGKFPGFLQWRHVVEARQNVNTYR